MGLKNVVILTMQRSRSSLVAAVIRAHGWNGGEGRRKGEKYPHGNGEPERTAFALRPRGGRHDNYSDLLAGEGWDPAVTAAELRGLLPPAPWYIKADAFAWPAIPLADAIVVLVRREAEAIVDSVLGKYEDQPCPYSREEIQRVNKLQQEEMDRVRWLTRGVDVDTDKLLAGDWTSLADVVTRAGGVWDGHIARQMMIQ